MSCICNVYPSTDKRKYSKNIKKACSIFAFYSVRWILFVKSKVLLPIFRPSQINFYFRAEVKRFRVPQVSESYKAKIVICYPNRFTALERALSLKLTQNSKSVQILYLKRFTKISKAQNFIPWMFEVTALSENAVILFALPKAKRNTVCVYETLRPRC